MKTKAFLLVLASCFGATVSHAQSRTTAPTAETSPAALAADPTSTVLLPDDSNEDKRSVGGELKLSLIGRQFNDENVTSRFSRATVSLDLRTKYREWLAARFKGVQQFTNGTASVLYSTTEGGAASNSFYADEASVTLIPLHTDGGFETRVSAGILRVEINPLSSAMVDTSWAAANFELEQKDQDHSLRFSATQGTPSSYASSNKIVDEDTLPLYTGANLTGESRLFGSDWKLAVSAGHFVFTDLSATMASDSKMIGSDTFGNGKGGVLFTYDYRGMEYATALSNENAAGDKFIVRGSSLVNELAPSESNHALLASVSYKRVLNRWDVTAGATAFDVQANSLPALFTSTTLGFANRKGQYVALKAENRKAKFALTAAYTHADVNDTNAFSAANGWQMDREVYSVGAEVKHDLF